MKPTHKLIGTSVEPIRNMVRGDGGSYIRGHGFQRHSTIARPLSFYEFVAATNPYLIAKFNAFRAFEDSGPDPDETLSKMVSTIEFERKTKPKRKKK